jgi:hypothetical protein
MFSKRASKIEETFSCRFLLNLKWVKVKYNFWVVVVKSSSLCFWLEISIYKIRIIFWTTFPYNFFLYFTFHIHCHAVMTTMRKCSTKRPMMVPEKWGNEIMTDLVYFFLSFTLLPSWNVSTNGNLVNENLIDVMNLNEPTNKTPKERLA